jgi:hypothetical protein
LISGYKKGVIALWDLVKYKLLRVVTDSHSTDITNAKIYHMSDDETLYAVTAEEQGCVCLIEFGKKSFLGGITYMS